MREIVGKMRLEEMVSDRQKFAELVKENAEPDLAAMGLDIISFNVQNFVDSNQVIENLGIDNIVKIKKSAAIARANSEKEIKIAQARANKEANDERVLAETEIAKKNNDLAIKSAELKKESDIKKAEADAAYKIQEEQQRKELEITSANANIARQEREVELRAREVEVTEKSLEAEVKKKAEAERYAKQQQAEADLYRRQKDAEADQFEKTARRRQRKPRQKPSAMRWSRKHSVSRQKVRRKPHPSAPRHLQRPKVWRRKPRLISATTKAAMAEMMIKVLPEIAGKIAEPLSQIDKITIIGGGSEDNGIGSVAGNVPVVMAKLFESMKEATGCRSLRNHESRYVRCKSKPQHSDLQPGRAQRVSESRSRKGSSGCRKPGKSGSIRTGAERRQRAVNPERIIKQKKKAGIQRNFLRILSL